MVGALIRRNLVPVFLAVSACLPNLPSSEILLSDAVIRVVSSQVDHEMERLPEGETQYLLDLWVRSGGQERWMAVACSAGAPRLANEDGVVIVPFREAGGVFDILQQHPDFQWLHVYDFEPSSCAHVFPLTTGELILSRLKVVANSSSTVSICVGRDLELLSSAGPDSTGGTTLSHMVERMRLSAAEKANLVSFRYSTSDAVETATLDEIRLVSPQCETLRL